jgi:hypothetical protein
MKYKRWILEFSDGVVAAYNFGDGMTRTEIENVVNKRLKDRGYEKTLIGLMPSNMKDNHEIPPYNPTPGMHVCHYGCACDKHKDQTGS